MSKWIIDRAVGILKGLANIFGGIIPLPDWATTAINYLLSFVASAGDMLKWMIPNETIYNSLIAIALIYIGVWLSSKIIGFAIRLYDLILV